MFFLLSLMFFLLQNWRTRGWDRVFPKAGGREGGGVPIMYMHVSKCKNDVKN
jgi:hypothetical protein